MLQAAHEKGLDEVILTCDEGNHGSIRIIESNGGELESRGLSEHSGVAIRRYRISP